MMSTHLISAPYAQAAAELRALDASAPEHWTHSIMALDVNGNGRSLTARRDLAEAKLAACADRVVVDAPPLSACQVERIQRLLDRTGATAGGDAE